jgi:hypothetical protein
MLSEEQSQQPYDGLDLTSPSPDYAMSFSPLLQVKGFLGQGGYFSGIGVYGSLPTKSAKISKSDDGEPPLLDITTSSSPSLSSSEVANTEPPKSSLSLSRSATASNINGGDSLLAQAFISMSAQQRCSTNATPPTLMMTDEGKDDQEATQNELGDPIFAPNRRRNDSDSSMAIASPAYTQYTASRSGNAYMITSSYSITPEIEVYDGKKEKEEERGVEVAGALDALSINNTSSSIAPSSSSAQDRNPTADSGGLDLPNLEKQDESQEMENQHYADAMRCRNISRGGSTATESSSFNSLGVSPPLFNTESVAVGGGAAAADASASSMMEQQGKSPSISLNENGGVAEGAGGRGGSGGGFASDSTA